MTPGEEFEALYLRPKKGRVLVAGSKLHRRRADRRLLYQNAVGWDMLAGEGVDRVIDLEEPVSGSFAHIDCVSMLEHCKRPWLVAQNLENLLKKGGTLLVAVPFVWRVHGRPDDYYRFTPSGIRQLFPRITWSVMKYANQKLHDVDEAVKFDRIEEHPYFPRTEIFAFGHK